MLTFSEWIEWNGQHQQGGGTVYSNPVNDDRYAEKGVRSKYQGDQAPTTPGSPFVDVDDMYLTGKKRARRKKQLGRSK